MPLCEGRVGRPQHPHGPFSAPACDSVFSCPHSLGGCSLHRPSPAAHTPLAALAPRLGAHAAESRERSCRHHAWCMCAELRRVLSSRNRHWEPPPAPQHPPAWLLLVPVLSWCRDPGPTPEVLSSRQMAQCQGLRVWHCSAVSWATLVCQWAPDRALAAWTLAQKRSPKALFGPGHSRRSCSRLLSSAQVPGGLLGGPGSSGLGGTGQGS